MVAAARPIQERRDVRPRPVARLQSCETGNQVFAFSCPPRIGSQPRGFPADRGNPGLRRRCLRWPHGSRRRAERRFRPYPEYTDSGVEWLGELPAHWEVRRLKTTASVQLSNVDKHSEEGQVPVRLCNYVDVYYNDLITVDLEFMNATATPAQVRRFRLRAGDVVITKDS